jgi:hypothetical protein
MALPSDYSDKNYNKDRTMNRIHFICAAAAANSTARAAGSG